MTDIRMALVGAGWMGRCHPAAYRAVGSVFEPADRPRLSVVSDIDGATAQAVASRFGFDRWGHGLVCGDR